MSKKKYYWICRKCSRVQFVVGTNVLKSLFCDNCKPSEPVSEGEK